MDLEFLKIPTDDGVDLLNCEASQLSRLSFAVVWFKFYLFLLIFEKSSNCGGMHYPKPTK